MPSQAEIQDYLRRSGDSEFHWEYPMCEFPRGWFTYKVDLDADAIIVLQAYGEAPELRRQAVMLARELGLPRIRYAVSSRAAVSARLFKGKIIASVIEVEA